MPRILVHFHPYTHVSLSKILITRERHFDEIFCFYVFFQEYIFILQKKVKICDYIFFSEEEGQIMHFFLEFLPIIQISHIFWGISH
jgi:hypothetical protein